MVLSADRADTDVITTIDPACPSSVIAFANSRIHRNTPRELTAWTLSHSSAVIRRIGEAPPTPALITAVSIFPRASLAWCTATMTLGSSATSQPMLILASPGTGSRSRSATTAPVLASRSTTAAPMPREPPTTTADLTSTPLNPNSKVVSAVRNSRAPGGVDRCMLVEIWSDVVCPWCYIGKRRFEAALENFEHGDEVEVRWRSFELDPNAPFRRPGRMAEHLSRKYGMTVEQAEERLESMNRLAAAEGLSYDLARTQAGNTFDAHRLVHLGYEKDSKTGAAVKEALLEAYFVELEPISEHDVLQRVGNSVNLEPEEVTALLESERFAEEVRADELTARDLGCTGVPFFVFDRAFAVPGAQDPATILAAMRRAWARAHPVEVVAPTSSSMCTDDSCAM